EPRAALAQRPPGVRALHAHGTEAILGPRLVLDAVRRLHRGDHAELRETRDVVRMDDLRVLDAVPQRARLRFLAFDPLEEVERLAVARIAERVDRHLEAGFHEVGHELLVEAILAAAHAAMAGAVRVVLEEPRSA